MADFDSYMVFFIIVCAIQNVIKATVTAPPTLDPDTTSMNISKGAILSLTCTGTYYLQWNTTTYGNITSRTSVRETYDEVLGLHKAILTVNDVIYADTGYFSCYYKGTENVESLGNISSIYIYVNDPENLLVPIDQPFIHINQNTQTIIPCRPTNPAVKISLTKNKIEVAVGSGDVRFDNRIGFIIMYGNIFFSGNFECVAKLDNITNTETALLFWMGNPVKTIPHPSIDLNGYDHIVIGRRFVLTCLINSDADSTPYFIDWDYPNPDKKTTRITESAVTKVKQISKNTNDKEIVFYQVLKNLTITDVEKPDQGIYTCTIRDKLNNSKTRQTYVLVHTKEETVLMLDADFKDQIQETDAGKDEVKYIVRIQSRPDPPELIWMKNKITMSQTANNKYHIENTNTHSVLVLKHLDRDDTANYTLIAKTETMEKSITLTLWVREPPVIFMKRSSGFHAENKRYENGIVCNVNGLPLPDIKWYFAQCESIGCTKRYDKQIRSFDTVNQEKITTVPTGMSEVRSSVSLTATVTGYYMCEAKNELSTTSEEYLFIVTDPELSKHNANGFGILTKSSTVLEKDKVNLECLANKFNFTNRIHWRFKKDELDGGVILSNRTGLRIISKETKHAHGLVLQFDSITIGDKGIYLCEAVGYLGLQKRKQKIDVLEIKAPYIQTTNMDGSSYAFSRESSFHFICNVSGVPAVTVEWKRYNETLSESTSFEYNFLNNYTVLEIPRVSAKDSGIYYCFAFNQAGELTLNATLTVEDSTLVAAAMPDHIKGIIISVVLLVIILVAILSIVLGRKCYLDKKEREEIYELEKELFKKGAIERYNPELPFEEQIEILPYDTRWEFPREKLKLGKTLGHGAFGRVVKAEAEGILQNESSTTVAVKMLKEHANVEQRKAIMQELKIMIHLGRHVNILNLLGACVQNPRRRELLIIMEYCKFGNLRNYLIRHRSNFINQINPETGEIDKRLSVGAAALTTNYSVPQSPTTPDYSGLGQDGYLVPLSPDSTQMTAMTTINTDSENTSDDSTGFGRINMSMRGAVAVSKKPLTTFDLVGYAFQTSRGMEYLAAKKLVHRDLATRNILLADNNTIKISDFGLTKDCYNKAYYRKKGDAPLPVKWMAIESIRDRFFSTESDVWSYGVVLWELFSLGSHPYPGLDVDENFYKKLLCGYRMDKPDFSTDEIYRIMCECWNKDSNQRPTFAELSDWVGDQLQTGMKEHYIELNNEYLKLYQLTTGNPDYVNMTQNGNIPDYVNVSTVSKDSEDEMSPESTVPDYLDMRGSNTPSMRNYELSRAGKTELKPMLSKDVPLRNNHEKDTSVRFSPNQKDSNSIHFPDEKNKTDSIPPTYSTVINDNFQL